MGLVSSSIPNLLNGVSQQPGPLRQPTQAELQENGLSDVADGLKKRPPTRFEGYLPNWNPGSNPTQLWTNNLAHETTLLKFFTFKGEVHCLAVVKNMNLNATNWPDLALQPVMAMMFTFDMYDTTTPIVHSDVLAYNYLSGTSAEDYLECVNPAQDLDILVTEDRVYVLNKSKTVAMDTGSNAIGSIHASRNSFSDLPDGTSGDTATAGQYYKILGAATTAFDHYYVKALSGNTYEECARPKSSGSDTSQPTAFDVTTLPIELTRASSGGAQYVWTADYIDYAERSCGDIDIVPPPSFVGTTINGMFFYKNRLGFLSGEEITFSTAGDFFNFWPRTATTILDDAPIDISLKYTDGTQLSNALVFNESLTVFSKTKQFSIDSAGPLTQQTISVTPSTDFDVNSEIPPVGAQNVLYFAVSKGGHTSIKEYFVEADTVRSDALELTAHVPKYIPKDIKQLVPSEANDMLFVLTKTGRLFVYKYFTDGQKKLQASWSEWKFNYHKICSIYAHEDRLFMLAKKAEIDITKSLMGLTINFSEEDTNVSAVDGEGNTINYLANLDTYTVSDASHPTTNKHARLFYDSALNETTITFGYKQVYWDEFREGLTILIDGEPVEYSLTSADGTSQYDEVYVKGNYTLAAGYTYTVVGHNYDFKYELSPQYIRENNGQQAVQAGRLQLKSMQVGFANTGYFKVDVTPKNRETFSHEYTGHRVNQVGSTIGNATINEGTFKFPVMSKNDSVKVEINSDSFLPCAFQTIDWEGFYTIRSKRI